MITRGFKPVGWVAAVGGAALCCYMLSLQVAAERAELASVERGILAARQDIRSLQTELGTRGRLQQLEHWNAEVLALSAPVAGQFLESTLSLARFDVRHRGLDGDVRLASAEAPVQRTAPAEVQLASVQAAPADADGLRMAAGLEEGAPAAGLVRRASLETMAPPAAPARRVVEARAPSLLDDGTLSDLRTESLSERGRVVRD